MCFRYKREKDIKNFFSFIHVLMRWTDFTQGSWETAAHGILYSYNLKTVEMGRECEEAICKIYKMQSLRTFNIGVVGTQQLQISGRSFFFVETCNSGGLCECNMRLYIVIASLENFLRKSFACCRMHGGHGFYRLLSSLYFVSKSLPVR